MGLVIYERRENIAFITLNRPERMNALTREMVDELADTWIKFRNDETWVGVLSGKGKSFCVGADLTKIDDLLEPKIPPASWLADARALRATPATYDIWKPIIAAVHGHVVGAGLWLAMGCDFLIAAQDTEFSAPEPLWGIPTTVAAPFLYHTLPMIANEILLVGDKISAQRAYQACMVNRVVAREKLMDSATALANRICENAPLAVRAMKQVIIRGRDLDYAGKMALTEHVFNPIRKSQDLKEGIRAFRKKTKPVWKCL